MKDTIVPSQYLQIALDLATRVAKGEIPAGSRIYGRSLMASEYNVSPETIRRALHLLADMKVVEVKPQSGTFVLSADSARRYIENFGTGVGSRALQEQMKSILNQYTTLNREMADVLSALLKQNETFSAASESLPSYEVKVPSNSPLIGKSIGELRFWQSTGGTIVAIRRGQKVVLSPGPYAELYTDDVIILVGNSAAAESAHRLVHRTLDEQ